MKAKSSRISLYLLVLLSFILNTAVPCAAAEAADLQIVQEGKRVTVTADAGEKKAAVTPERGGGKRFIAYNNGTVLDTRTRLMWAAKDNGWSINWPDAKSYCEKYRGGGYTDWRLPKQDELAELYDRTVTGKNGNHLTTLIELTRCCMWGTETRGSIAAYFSFFSGLRGWLPQTDSSDDRVLPVRSSK